MTGDLRTQVIRRVRRRYIFGVHAVISGLLGIVFVVDGLTGPFNYQIINSQRIFSAFASPWLIISGILLLTIVALHGLLLLRAERLNQGDREDTAHRYRVNSRSLVSVHAVVTCMMAFNTWVLVQSGIELNTVQSQVIYVVLFTLILSFIPLVIGWLYKELLNRALTRIDTKPKPKNVIKSTLTIGDDGELFYSDEPEEQRQYTAGR